MKPKTYENKLYDYAPLGFKLSYEKAKELAKGGCYITREQWDGFHFIDIAPDKTETYIIVLKDGTMLINPQEIQDTDKMDWGIVYITKKSLKIIEGKVVLLEE